MQFQSPNAKNWRKKNREEAVLRNTLLDNLPCTALILEKKTRKIVASNKIAQEAGAIPREICHKICANRAVPCTFCLAPKLWETNETQTLEVEYEGKHYRGIWMPYNEDLYVHYIFDITEDKKLEEKLKVISGFTRHDIRNKLLAWSGNLYLLRKMLRDKPEAEKYISEIEKMTSSISEILEASKIYEMLGSQKLTLIDVGSTVKEGMSLFGDLKGIEVVNQVEGLEVVADHMLSTVFHNLIDNTLKYAKNASQIRIYAQNNRDSSLSLIYEDNGVGIKTEDKPNLFKKGFGKGTGYGLFLIMETCEIYGWTITEIGEPGKGVKFVISIPAVRVTEK